MAGTAVLGRVTWRSATVVGLHDETTNARTIALAVRDWPGHIAGQHVDLRLTAPDGYSAVRSYSIASAPSSDGRLVRMASKPNRADPARGRRLWHRSPHGHDSLACFGRQRRSISIVVFRQGTG